MMDNKADMVIFVPRKRAASITDVWPDIHISKSKYEYEYEYEIFIASGTNIKYMETTYNKDWQTYINRNSTKVKD